MKFEVGNLQGSSGSPFNADFMKLGMGASSQIWLPLQGLNYIGIDMYMHQRDSVSLPLGYFVMEMTVQYEFGTTCTEHAAHPFK